MDKKGKLDRLSSRQGKTNLERMRRDKVSEHSDSDTSRTLSSIKKKHLLIENEIEELLTKKKEEITLPISIFNEKLGMLEAASLYLKDELNLSFNDIAKLLKRNYKTIWTSYKKAKKKNER